MPVELNESSDPMVVGLRQRLSLTSYQPLRFLDDLGCGGASVGWVSVFEGRAQQGDLRGDVLDGDPCRGCPRIPPPRTVLIL